MVDAVTSRCGKVEIPLAPFFKGGEGDCAYQSSWSLLLEGGVGDCAYYTAVNDLLSLKIEREAFYIWEGNRNV